MEELLHGIPGVLCYLDDILICGVDDTTHMTRLRVILNKLQDIGLKLRADKCTFGASEVTYLGYLINEAGINPTDEKLQAIKDAPAPTDVTQVRAYLGMITFYHRFLPKAASMLEPLHMLLRSQTKLVWGPEQNKAFIESKKALLNSGALVHFNPDHPMVVVADSSAYGIGATLCHLIDGQERPVYFASRSLNKAERNYSQLEKEALAMIFALKKFHNYLWGQKCTIITDYKPLLGIFSPTKPLPTMASDRIQR